MNQYEERQDRKKELYEKSAEKAKKEAQFRYNASKKLIERIPMGQPILVGHHSEKRHRGDLKRSDSHMRKSIEASEKATYYENKANAVGTGGISSDDPDAIQKIKEKIENITTMRDLKKKINAWYRKHKALEGCPHLTPDSTPVLNAELERQAKAPWVRKVRPCPNITGDTSEIRRLTFRLIDLEAREKMPKEITVLREGKASDGTPYAVKAHPEDEGGRIWFVFAGKPSKEICKKMRTAGWKWSPTRVAWIRNLNNAGMAAIDYPVS